MRKFIFVLFTLHSSLFTPHVCEAQIIHVPADQPTIQKGINAAAAGDTVLVDDSTYLENINFMGKAITVASNFIIDGDTNHINNTIINGSQPANPDSGSVVTFISGEDTTSVICGFTITGGTGLYLPTVFMRMGGGVVCFNAGAKIAENKIINNTVSNTSYPAGGGIAFNSGNSDSWIVILNNTIKDNTVVADQTETFGGGIYIMGNAQVKSNVIDNNHCNLLSTSGEIQGGGLYAESSSSNPLDTLILSDNIIQNNVVEGGDYIVGGGIACGDVFSCPVSFLTNNMIVSNSVISGGTGYGSGIFLQKIHGEVLIQDNQIQFNSVESGGAGGIVIWIDQPLSRVKILSNLISDNWATSGNNYAWAAGIWLWDAESADVFVDGNIIKNNSGNRAGGFYARNSYNFHLINNIFTGNNVDVTGGAVQLHQYYAASKELIPFKKSMLTPKGSVHPVIANNTFSNNHASQNGGAIYIGSYYDSICPLIFNNIFWENEVSTGTGKDIYHDGDEYLVIKNNNIDTDSIYGNWEGDGNIFKDPTFSGDSLYHLDDSSPCINAGIDSLFAHGQWWFCPATDIDGEARPFPSVFCDPLPDIGVDEADFDCAGIATPSFQNSKFKVQSYPNPFSDYATMKFSLPTEQHVSLKVYDLTGREIKIIVSAKLPEGEHQYTLSAAGLEDGVYFCRLKARDNLVTRKIVVQR